MMIDGVADMKSLERSSAACRRLMTIPGVGRLTPLAFAATFPNAATKSARNRFFQRPASRRFIITY
jgi:transposase